MTEHDVLVGFRLRLFTLADELGNVSAACRAMGVDRSTYYRLKRRVDRWGLEALNVRERRRPRMPNQIGPHLEQRIIAFALGHPGYGPRRISAELAREKWGGLRISEHGVWRVLVRVGLNTRAKRLALIARHRDPYERKPELAAARAPHRRHRAGREGPARLLLRRAAVGHQGHRLAIHRHRRRLGFCWAELHTSERNPRSRHTRELLHRVAAELAAAGWKLRRGHHRQRLGVPRHATSARPSHALGARQRFIRAGTAQQQRLRRTRPADHPRGVLAPRVRPLTGPQEHRAQRTTSTTTSRLQLRPRPHRAPHPRTRARRHRLLCASSGSCLSPVSSARPPTLASGPVDTQRDEDRHPITCATRPPGQAPPPLGRA